MDLIERQVIINELESWLKVRGYSKGELNIIKAVLYEMQSMPFAQPEIIRCKDCKFWKKYGYINGKPEFLPKCGFNQIYTSKDDFCSRAERKNRMDDLISRQAAIDALKYNQDVYSHNFHDDPIDKYTTAIIAADIDTLVKLPSAQPEPCGEVVSREVVVKFFNDWMSALDINCHHQSVADLRIIKGDIKNLPSAQPEQRWIPLKEREPKEEGEYLVSFDDGFIATTGYYDNDFELWADAGEPLAWMPLPEPYKEGTE